MRNRIAAWVRARLGWGSPSRDMAEAAGEFAPGFAAGIDPPPSTVPPERVAGLLRLYDLAEKLKKTERCSSSWVEGQQCVTADVRWSGRELKRLLDGLVSEEERRAVDDARWARALEAIRAARLDAA